MPQPRTSSRRSSGSSSRNGSKKRAADLTTGPVQAPSAQEQHNRFNILSALVDSIGHKPFSARKIPISDLYEMRTDAVLSFAQLYSKMPLYTTPWWIKCRSAKKSAFYTEALRLIIGRLITQVTLSWDFGWQSIVKQFGELNPDWVYVDPEDPTGPPKPVWDEGDIPAIVWKPFIPLRPEIVSPRWSSAGRFDGINLEGMDGNYSFPTVISYENSQRTGRYIPLDFALWVVNERDSHFGSTWGFPRLSYAYKFWWAYEMSLGITTRAVEKKGDPTIEVRYPEGKSKVGDNEVDNQVIAKRIGRSARSGAVLTLPSETIRPDLDRTSNEPKWKVSTLELDVDFDKLQGILTYLDTQKIRSMMVADQAVQEGSGGTSSRNVAKEMGEQSQRMSIFTMGDLADVVNRYMIPQLDERNFPELRDSPATFEYLDIAQQDLELYRILLQGKSNSDAGEIPIDWREVLERLKIPALSQDAIAARTRQLEKQAEEQRPPEVAAVPGQSAGVTDTGFYYEVDGKIDFGEDDVLLASLPPTKHYSDAAVLATTRLIRKLALDRYKDQYESFARYLESGKVELDMEASRRLTCPLCQKVQSAKNHQCKECAHDLVLARRERFAMLAEALLTDEDERQKVVDRILGGWKYSSSVSKRVVGRLKQAFSTVFKRAGELELKSVGLATDEWNPDEKELAEYVEKNAANMVTTVDATTRDELRTFLLNQVKHDRTPSQIAKAVREHFSDFPGWKADRLARSEVRKFYNAATLFAAEAAGVKKVQALDARHGPTDAECERRNGRFFPIKDAWKEDAKEHPWGTLAWRMITRDVKVVQADVADMADYRARFDRTDGVVYIRRDLDARTEGEFLEQVGARIEQEAALAA